jgi:hypothetical protein
MNINSPTHINSTTLLPRVSAPFSHAPSYLKQRETMYPYSTLSAAAKEVRLLTLMPGCDNDPIEASLSTESLQGGSIYEVCSSDLCNSFSSLPPSSFRF